MPSLYQLKPAFRQLLRPISAGLHRHGVTANQITIAAATLSIVYGASLALYSHVKPLWLALPLFLILRMALNALDGMIASDFVQQSACGAFLNELGDIVSDAALILGFSGLAVTVSLPAALFALTGTVTEAAGLCAQAVCGIRRYDGPMGKSDRACVLGVLGLLIGLDWISIRAVEIVFIVGSAAACLTAVQRARMAIRIAA